MNIPFYSVIDVQLRSNGQPYMFACRDRTVLILILALALSLFFCHVLNLYKRFCKLIKEVSTTFACRRGYFLAWMRSHVQCTHIHVGVEAAG